MGSGAARLAARMIGSPNYSRPPGPGGCDALPRFASALPAYHGTGTRSHGRQPDFHQARSGSPQAPVAWGELPHEFRLPT